MSKPALFLLIFFLPTSLPAADGGFDRDKYMCRDTALPFFAAPRPGEGFVLPGRFLAMDFSFPAVKRQGETRVFVAGESAATLLGAGEGFAAEGVGIVNCGMGGYDSRRITGVFREIMDQAPDLAVLLSGNNEGWEDPCPGAAGRLRRAAYRALVRWLPEGERGPGRVSLAVHEYRVRRMARLAKKKKVPFVICSLPANLLMPPFGEAPYGDGDFASGLLSLEKKDFRGAGESFRAFLAGSPRDAFGLYFTGLALHLAGDQAGARPYLSAAADMSPAQDRSGPARNRMLKKVALEEGACFADLEGLFARISPGGAPGFGEFDDSIHWRAGLNGAVWGEIAVAAEACGFPKGLLVPGGAPEEEGRKLLSYAFAYSFENHHHEMGIALADYLYRSRPGLLKKALSSPAELGVLVKKSPWFDSSPERSSAGWPAFLLAAGEALRRNGRYSEALRLADGALSVDPDNAMASFLRGAALFGLGRLKEAEAVLSVLALSNTMGKRVRAFCAARGIPLPEPLPNISLRDIAKSKELSEKGTKSFARRDYKAAAGYFRRALEKDPTNRGAAISLEAAEAEERKRGSAPDSI